MAHPTFEPGQVIAGRYVVKHSLGKGGMASLYAVHPVNLSEGELLALKAVPLIDERQRKRLRAEFETLSHLRHRGIVRVFEHAEDAATGCAFYLMEYVRGSALTRVVRDSFMNLADSMELFRDVLEAVAYLHAQGVVHRDLKPDNLLVCRDGRVVIIDFGICRSPSRSEITDKKDLSGTPLFLSPEQASLFVSRAAATPEELAVIHGPRADVYALGVLLYHLLANEWPRVVPSGSPEAQLELLHRLRYLQPRSPLEVNPDAPAALARLALSMLQPLPAERPATAGLVLAAFEQALAQDGPALEQTSPLVVPVLEQVIREEGLARTQLHVEPRGPWRGILSYAAIGLGCLLTGLFMRAPSAPTLSASVAPEPAPMGAATFSGLADASTPLPSLLLGARLITGPIPGQKRPPCIKYPNLEVPLKGACWYVFGLPGPSAEEAAKGCARDDVYEPEPGWCKRGSDIGWPRVYVPTMLDKPVQPPVSVLEPTPSDGGDPSAGAPR